MATPDYKIKLDFKKLTSEIQDHHPFFDRERMMSDVNDAFRYNTHRDRSAYFNGDHREEHRFTFESDPTKHPQWREIEKRYRVSDIRLASPYRSEVVVTLKCEMTLGLNSLLCYINNDLKHHNYPPEHYNCRSVIEPIEEPKEKTMNLNTVAAIVNDNVTSIKVELPHSSQLFTYKAMNTLATTLEKDDIVVVERGGGYGAGIGKVVSVDEEIDMDPEDGIEYKWAFAKVDTSVLKGIKDEEAALVKKLNTNRRANMKAQVLAQLGVDENLKLLEE